MKKLILILLFLFLVSNAYAFNPLIVCPGAVASGTSCDSALWTNTTVGTADYDITDLDAFYFVGTRVTPTEDVTICKVDFYVSYKTGDISEKIYTASISTTSTNDLSSMTDADDTVTGSNSWSAASNSTGTVITFEWSDGYSMSADTQYAITIEMDGTDGSNYAELEYSVSTAIPGGYVSRWNGDLSINGQLSGSLPKMIIYGSVD